MTLIKLILEGVGGYNALRTFDFHAAFNVITGPNETGKSSLKRAIEIVYKGFKSAEDRHSECDQSRLEAFFSTQEGMVRVLRTYGKRASGQRIHEETSHVTTIGNGPAFEGIEPEVFGALFAIGLDELSEIGAKDWSLIESRLLGHYATGAVAVPTQVLERLGREMSALYRENGRGNYELKAVLAALKTSREMRRGALQVLESQASLDRMSEDLTVRIAAREQEMRLWQERADAIAQRPDLISKFQECEWLRQRMLPYDVVVIPDRDAFEVFENEIKQRALLELSLSQANRLNRRAGLGVLAALIIGALILMLTREPLMMLLTGAILAGAIWNADRHRRDTKVFMRESEALIARHEKFIKNLPFEGARAVEESLELLEARERFDRLRLELLKDPAYVRFKRWLPEKPLTEAEQLAVKAQLEIAALEKERFSLDLRSKRQEALTELELAEREILKSENRRNEIAAEWDRLLLETLIVEEADRSFRERRRYDFLTNASLYLERLTCGRYTRILSQPEQPGRFVMEGPGVMRQIDNRLSRGTREQVYLALKLGLMDALDAEGKFPLLLDDVAVNFDRERRNGFDALLVALVARRQVFYFTCREGREVLSGGEALPETFGGLWLSLDERVM